VNCSFNGVDIPSNHPGTRSTLLKELDNWIRSNTPICWLTGPVGSGKTSIAQTLAKKCSEQKTLVANFFFDRNKRSGIELLIPSLIYTMCISNYSTIPYVEQVYGHERSIFQDSTRDYQFRRLLLEVLSAVLEEKPTKSRRGIMQPRTRLVIVIDGIDQCSDEGEMGEFVKMLVGIPSGSSPKLLTNVRILLTGRIADHFEEARESQEFRGSVKEINIQDIDAAETTKDIRKFIKDGLKGIRRGSSFTLKNISSDEQLGGLVALSKGSFHVAQTILHYIDHKDMSKRFSGLLQSSNDRLYKFFAEVLDQSSDFEEVLGTVTYLNSPLSLAALRRIFTSHQIDPFPSLFQINALLSIPAGDKQPIQPICESLWEYLKAPLDSGGYRFDGLKAHFSLAASCLEITAQLSEGDEGPSHSVRSTKLGWVQHAEAQQYASIHWFGHLLQWIKIGKSGRLKEIAELMSKSNVLEENISILLDSSKSSFVLWTNILIFKIDDTQKILEDMQELNMNMEVGRYF
jgi:energy-coupling factor transporter ATP-binding protein EcfA2